MAINVDGIQRLAGLGIWAGIYGAFAFVVYVLLRTLYNVSPLHPLAKYPGPLLWRCSRLPASYHHATGDLYQCIAAIHAKYGNTVRIAPDELSLTSPNAWAQIYNSRPQLKKTDFHFAPSEGARLPESMITASDAEHARLRRLAGPAFLNSGIKEVEPVLQHYVDLLCSQLAAASHEGSQNMVEWFLWALNDVIGQLALDQEFECLTKRRMHPWPSFLLNVLKQTALLNQLRRFNLSLKLLTPFLTKEMLDAREGFINTANQAVKERLAAEDAPGSEKKRADIVGLMLREMKNSERLTEAEITSNSILIVGGGAETTSTCLSATLYHLCKTPRVMRKLADEVRRMFANSEDITIQAVNKMDYLKATIDESLRIFPVASYITPRMTPSNGHVIAGNVIPANTYVSMAQWHMGRSSEFFTDPLQFKPERWMDTADADDRIGPNGMTPDETLRPFSLGPRNCLGKLLALAEARLVTAKLLWHFDLELDGPQETWVQDARFYILWQLKPLMVKLTPVER